jgi:hypothetical protein
MVALKSHYLDFLRIHLHSTASSSVSSSINHAQHTKKILAELFNHMARLLADDYFKSLKIASSSRFQWNYVHVVCISIFIHYIFIALGNLFLNE